MILIKKYIEKINNSKMPFLEDGNEKTIKKKQKKDICMVNKEFIKNADTIIVCIGTPVKKSEPDLKFFFKMFKEVKHLLDPKNH